MSCRLGCTTVCKAKEHGSASECPALPWQPAPPWRCPRCTARDVPTCPHSPQSGSPLGLDITRRGDMGENTLRVLTDADGDVIVEVFSPERGAVAAEFCTGIGGGHSPNTRRALLALILAIEQDQAERPLRGDLRHHE